MRSDFIRQLFSAFAQGDKDKFLQVAFEIVKEEEKKSHAFLARDLKAILKEVTNGKNFTTGLVSNHYKDTLPIPRDTEKGFPLLEIKEFDFDWDDVILSQELKAALLQIIEEIKQSDVLASYGLKPKQKVLFCGPPGTGKTLSTQVVSSVLRYPFVYIRFDSIVSSFLGETASNLRKIFNFIDRGQWVVLFDEFDIIGKHRDDPHEHGEIKRIVNNFIQMLDNYSGDSLLISATNHQHLLDPALWRRFDEILFFDIPDANRRKQIFLKYLKVLQKEKDLNMNILVEATDNFTPADIAQICWESLKKSIIDNKKEIAQECLMQAIAQQKRRKVVEGRRNGTRI